MVQDDMLEPLADAALRLAPGRPWSDIAFGDLAQEAALPLDRVYGRVRTKTDVVDALSRRFDREAARDLEAAPDADVRERVFDAAMARFDAMEPHRAGLKPILKAARSDPALAARGVAMTARSACWLLEIAGVDTSGLGGALRVQGFALILARALRAWESEEAPGLARTMAALDRGLRDAEDWISRFSRSKPHAQRSAFDTEPESQTAPPAAEAEKGPA